MTLLEKLRDHLASTQEPDPIYKECYKALLNREQVATAHDALLRCKEFLETPVEQRQVTPYVEVCRALAATEPKA